MGPDIGTSCSPSERFSLYLKDSGTSLKNSKQRNDLGKGLSWLRVENNSGSGRLL